MNIDAFVKKYLGKKVDFDGAYGGQCVDLYRQYCKEVLNVPQSPPIRGAADIWDTYLKDHFIRIANTPNGVPKKGDIILWNKNAGGGFGHVAIFLEGDAHSFTSLDQNWPTLSEVTKTKHGYKDVLGWLTPKVWIEDLDDDEKIENKYSQEEYDKVRLERDKNWNLYQTEIEKNKDLHKEMSRLNDEVGERKREADQFTEDMAKRLDLPATADRSMILSRVSELLNEEEAKRQLEKKLDEEQRKHDQEINKLLDDVAQLRAELEEQKKRNETLMNRLDKLEQQAVGVQEKKEEINFLEYIMNLLKRK